MTLCNSSFMKFCSCRLCFSPWWGDGEMCLLCFWTGGWWCLSWMFCLIVSHCLAVYDPNNMLLMAWCRCNGSDYSKCYHPVGGCFNPSEIYSSNTTSTPSRGEPNNCNNHIVTVTVVIIFMIIVIMSLHNVRQILWQFPTVLDSQPSAK